MQMRWWVETPDGLNIRITVRREDDRVFCRVDPGVPGFDAPPIVLRSLARALDACAGAADDIRWEAAEAARASGVIHNPKNLEGRLPIVPAMLPAPPSTRYVRSKTAKKPGVFR